MVGETKHIVPRPQTPYELINKIIEIVEPQVIRQLRIQLLKDQPGTVLQGHYSLARFPMFHPLRESSL